MQSIICALAFLLFVGIVLYAFALSYYCGMSAGKRTAYLDVEEPASWLHAVLTAEERIQEAKSNRRHLREHIDETCLRIIEKRFCTHLPAFQKIGDTYNPYDAMRRDGAREVVLYLRHQLELAEKESDE